MYWAECFEDVLHQLEQKRILAQMQYPNKEKYPNQQIWVFELHGYVYYVPFVENEDEIFLKSIIPSRKLQKQFKGASHEPQNPLP